MKFIRFIILFPLLVYQNYESETESANDGEGGSKYPASRARERDFDDLVIINRTRPSPCD